MTMSQLRSEPSSVPNLQELAYALLVLERQLSVYQRLHQEDLAALRSALEELRERLLSLVANTG